MIRYDYIPGEVAGLSTLFVVPSIPDDAPPEVREGIARRRLATIVGRCPCGARRPHLNRAMRRQIQQGRTPQALTADIEHENDCAAISEEVMSFMRGDA